MCAGIAFYVHRLFQCPMNKGKLSCVYRVHRINSKMIGDLYPISPCPIQSPSSSSFIMINSLNCPTFDLTYTPIDSYNETSFEKKNTKEYSYSSRISTGYT